MMSNVKTSNRTLVEWVEKIARTTQPDRIYWCDGSREEYERLVGEMVDENELIELNQKQWPDCYLYRSDPNDVARTENLTFICTEKKEDAGPTNNWMSPAETHQKVGSLFKGCMKGRTMYVIPYLMGPVGSELSRFGCEITDSRYVAASMEVMTRAGQPALDHLGQSDEIVYGMHSIGELDPNRRFICHLPEERLIMSYGSGYGGNALLGKKCHALRLASTVAREQGWLAEHMLIVGVEDPAGEITYMTGAFPSACGKTNLAMLVPPPSQEGYKVWTIGDDIAWLKPDKKGKLWAINPESGFFGVLPGTGKKTNPNAMAMIQHNTLFTNAAMAPDREPWWEGRSDHPPPQAEDWQGNPWTPAAKNKAAHPNARFTVPVHQCPSISPKVDDPEGVPISAMIFGGRRSKLAPLVYEAFDWEHAVYVGAMMASESTAAATGAVGVLKRDPMAMRPFCGYNMADYWAHWFEMGRRHKSLPRVFHVNWFRVDDNGKFMWPGFGENLRVLRWIQDRIRGRAEAVETPIGFVPAEGALDLTGLNVSEATMRELLKVDPKDWREEMADREEYLKQFGARLPKEMISQHEAEKKRLGI